MCTLLALKKLGLWLGIESKILFKGPNRTIIDLWEIHGARAKFEGEQWLNFEEVMTTVAKNNIQFVGKRKKSQG